MDTTKAITEQIHQCGLSDAEVARRVGSSQPTIWRIRTGKTSDCSSELYRCLAKLRDELAADDAPLHLKTQVGTNKEAA